MNRFINQKKFTNSLNSLIFKMLIKSQNRSLTETIDGTPINLFQPMCTLHNLGSYVARKRPKHPILVLPYQYRRICPIDISGLAISRMKILSKGNLSEQSFSGALNLDLMDLGAEEISMGKIYVELQDLNQDYKILQSLEDIGYAWDKFDLDGRANVVVHQPPHIHNLDLQLAVDDAVDRYDRTMFSEKPEDQDQKRRYKELDLNDLYIGIGQNLVHSSDVPIISY